MSTIIIITPPKKENRTPGVQEFHAEHIDGARTSDILRAVADQMDAADESGETEPTAG